MLMVKNKSVVRKLARWYELALNDNNYHLFWLFDLECAYSVKRLK